MVRALGLFLAWAAGIACAHGEDAPYKPRVGQEGRDVAWVPSPQVLVDRTLDMARLSASDFLIDLGSGDGRTVIAAAKRGARALGIEYNPELVKLGRQNAAQAGVAHRASFVQADLFASDLSRATVVTLFLAPALNLKLRPKLLALAPGTRVASIRFTMGDWTPDQALKLTPEHGCSGVFCRSYLWIVPARVSGTWRTRRGELRLEQNFQALSGTLVSGGRTVTLVGRVRGTDVVLNGPAKPYLGRLNGNNLEID